jgi:hypothetical protein
MTVHHFHYPYGEYPHVATEPFEYTATTKRLRHFLYEHFITKGRGPDIREMMEGLRLGQDEVWEALVQLQQGTQLMFVPGTENIVKVPPFSYVASRHHAYVDDGREYWVGCAGETPSTHMLFPGHEVTVKSTCPCCFETVTTVWKDGELLSADPVNAVVHIGKHPDDWGHNMVETCDNINLFRNLDHVAAWERQFPEKAGATLPVQKVFSWVEREARQRFWNYDYGPGLVGANSVVGTTVELFRDAGFDVAHWEEPAAVQA